MAVVAEVVPLDTSWTLPTVTASRVVVDFDSTGPDVLRIEDTDGTAVTHLQTAGTVPGVVVLHAAARNGPGTGRLLVNATADGLQWRAPGSSTYGIEVAVPDDGVYLLRDGDDPGMFVRVEVWTEYLEAAAWSEVQLRDVFENTISHDDVTATEAAAGDVADYPMLVRNTSVSGITELKVWIDAAVSGIEISDDGITWVSPITEAAALAFGSLGAGLARTLFLRRTIGAAAPSDDEVLTHLHFSFLGA